MSGIDWIAHAESVRERDRRAALVQVQTEVCEAAKIFASMSPEDRAVWLRMLRVGHDYNHLVDRCSAIKAKSTEPALLPDGSLPMNKMVPTPHETFALATLLGAIRDQRRIVLKNGGRR